MDIETEIKRVVEHAQYAGEHKPEDLIEKMNASKALSEKSVMKQCIVQNCLK